MVPLSGQRGRSGAGAGRFLLSEHQGARRRGRAESLRDGSGAGAPAAVGLALCRRILLAQDRQRRAGRVGKSIQERVRAHLHFCRQPQIKFRPKAVGHESEDCFDYNPNNPKSTSGSGLLGTGPRGAAADGGKNQSAWQRSRSSLSDDSEGRHAGVARPSNVIEVRTESGQGSHSAPFPRPLVEFFLLAFSDADDVVFDPFMGSGTTMAAAALLERVGYGCEISPAYCDVILRRIMNLTGETATLAETGEAFPAAEARGMPSDQALNPTRKTS